MSIHDQDELFWLGRAQRRRADSDALRFALHELLDAVAALPGLSMPPADAPCHYGVVPQEKCAHCNRIARLTLARNAAENVLKAKP